MSSKKINYRGIGPRLTIISTLVLSLSLIFVSSTVYYLLSTTLRNKDQALLERLAVSYSQSIKIHKGFQELVHEISPEVMVKILDKKGDEVYSHLPEYIEQDFDDDQEIKEIDHTTKQLSLKNRFNTILLLSGEEDDDFFQKLEYRARRFTLEREWFSILPLIDNDLFEVYTMPLDHGGWIRVGRSSEETEEHLSSIRKVSLMVIIPFIFIGFFFNWLLSRSILAPLKNLANTIGLIKRGDLKARGRVSNSGDEVDLLASEFNTLLDQNEKLISNLKSTIDNVAHDLRTPLTRFRVGVESALTLSDDKEVFREALQDGLENADKMKDLLNAIMDVSEAETQTMNLKKETIPLGELAQNLEELYLYTAEEKHIQIKVSIQDEVTVSGDKVRLAQAFGNLLDNALKFSPDSTQVVIKVYREGEFGVMDIIDEGIGIDEIDRERIWERLYRGDKSRSTSGLGIGLSVVNAIIKAHQGSIQLKTEAKKGSTFSVKLPLRHDPVIKL